MARHANFASGDVVTIYQDPITQQEPEGKARLLRILAKNGGTPQGEFGKVRFANGDFAERWIYPD